MTSRREWLGSLGAMAVGGFAAGRLGPGLNAAMGVDAVDNPAANVGDRTTTIKITRLTATPVRRKVFLKVETNHGVTGWGEIDQLEPFVAAALARSLYELLDGENPTRLRPWTPRGSAVPACFSCPCPKTIGEKTAEESLEISGVDVRREIL